MILLIQTAAIYGQTLWLDLRIDPEAFVLSVEPVLLQPINAELTARVKKNNGNCHVLRILADYLAAAFYQQALLTEEPQLDDQYDERSVKASFTSFRGPSAGLLVNDNASWRRKSNK